MATEPVSLSASSVCAELTGWARVAHCLAMDTARRSVCDVAEPTARAALVAAHGESLAALFTVHAAALSQSTAALFNSSRAALAAELRARRAAVDETIAQAEAEAEALRATACGARGDIRRAYNELMELEAEAARVRAANVAMASERNAAEREAQEARRAMWQLADVLSRHTPIAVLREREREREERYEEEEEEEEEETAEEGKVGGPGDVAAQLRQLLRRVEAFAKSASPPPPPPPLSSSDAGESPRPLYQRIVPPPPVSAGHVSLLCMQSQQQQQQSVAQGSGIVETPRRSMHSMQQPLSLALPLSPAGITPSMPPRLRSGTTTPLTTQSAWSNGGASTRGYLVERPTDWRERMMHLKEELRCLRREIDQ